MTTAFGVVCTLSVFLPVAVILAFRLYTHKSLLALAVNGFVTGMYNLMNVDLIPVSKQVLAITGIINNYIDGPLMLIALLFFCPNRSRQRPVHLLTLLLVVYSLVVGFRFGFDRQSIVYVLGPSLLLILSYTGFLFSRQVRFTVARGKNAGRMLMLASILFAYGCYGLMYLFFYVFRTENVNDIYLLYHITTLVASVLMTAGLHLTRKRIREFREVRNTRRELAVFFGQATPREVRS